jgi:MraZ protein
MPPSHRDRAGINKNVLLVGIMNKIEIWDAKAWEARHSQNGDKIGEALASLGL